MTIYQLIFDRKETGTYTIVQCFSQALIKNHRCTVLTNELISILIISKFDYNFFISNILSASLIFRAFLKRHISKLTSTYFNAILLVFIVHKCMLIDE